MEITGLKAIIILVGFLTLLGIQICFMFIMLARVEGFLFRRRDRDST